MGETEARGCVGAAQEPCLRLRVLRAGLSPGPHLVQELPVGMLPPPRPERLVPTSPLVTALRPPKGGGKTVDAAPGHSPTVPR